MAVSMAVSTDSLKVDLKVETTVVKTVETLVGLSAVRKVDSKVDTTVVKTVE